ncbi:universal stress protein [Microbacterium betulae]|uniref:Universal stress protein n=1 Tax=Microbacterium betulae TaxID=2981139 RepID=A0AA97FIK2_9MICO|nr:universal stress protein [Microbacterium sp. AB]WOF22689.1 universal stress protein [Microbacterium sp. AB]
MSDDEVFPADEASTPGDDEALRGAVVAGAIPGQPPRVLREAAKYAALLHAPLVVTHVDVTRFVTYEDPDGFVQTAPIDIHVDVGAEELDAVRQVASEALAGQKVTWAVRQLVGDPALALKHFADKIDARLIVVGTRKRGIGDSIREFFTGSVAARLSHRQHRSILVVPLGEPLEDDEDWPIEE